MPFRLINFRMVPESRCSVRIRLDAPEIEEEEEKLNIRKETFANPKDALLISLRQFTTNDVCCAIEDIIEVEEKENEVEGSCDEQEGFQ